MDQTQLTIRAARAQAIIAMGLEAAKGTFPSYGIIIGKGPNGRLVEGCSSILGLNFELADSNGHPKHMEGNSAQAGNLFLAPWTNAHEPTQIENFCRTFVENAPKQMVVIQIDDLSQAEACAEAARRSGMLVSVCHA